MALLGCKSKLRSNCKYSCVIVITNSITHFMLPPTPVDSAESALSARVLLREVYKGPESLLWLAR